MELVAEAVTVHLSGRSVVNGIDMVIPAGEVVGLLGPNGAGKSTLMRAATGQIAFAGAIRIGGEDLASLSHGERARRIAYLPQNRIIGWPLSVARVVGLGRLPWQAFGRKPNAADQAICDEAMEVMDISHLADRPATELSGGEQARVLAARAIAQDTPLLIADEPASGLDPAHQITMMAALRRLSANGKTILVSLHDLTLAARWCDRIIMLKDGAAFADGTPAEVMTAPVLRRVFGITAHIDHDEGGLVLAPTGLASTEQISLP